MLHYREAERVCVPLRTLSKNFAVSLDRLMSVDSEDDLDGSLSTKVRSEVLFDEGISRC